MNQTKKSGASATPADKTSAAKLRRDAANVGYSALHDEVDERRPSIGQASRTNSGGDDIAPQARQPASRAQAKPLAGQRERGQERYREGVGAHSAREEPNANVREEAGRGGGSRQAWDRKDRDRDERKDRERDVRPGDEVLWVHLLNFFDRVCAGLLMIEGKLTIS